MKTLDKIIALLTYHNGASRNEKAGRILQEFKADGWKSPEEHDARVAELLNANSAEVERRRDAENMVSDLLELVRRTASKHPL